MQPFSSERNLCFIDHKDNICLNHEWLFVKEYSYGLGSSDHVSEEYSRFLARVAKEYLLG